MRRLSYAAQADYGKWLISSIFLMHGAAIGGLAFKAGATGAPTYLAAILWFVGGLVLALASGFSAWRNFSLAAQQYDGWAKRAMLFDAKWPTEATHSRAIKVTMGLGISSDFVRYWLLSPALSIFGSFGNERGCEHGDSPHHKARGRPRLREF
jgi:hypothetical protein